MLRLYPTLLHAYRRYLTNEYATEAELIATVKRTGFESNVMRYGSAFHAILEKPISYKRDGVMPRETKRKSERDVGPATVYTCQGITFMGTDIERALMAVDREGLNEVRTVKHLRLPDGTDIVMSGRVDQIKGNVVGEYKTRWGEFDIERYYLSPQWKIYTVLFGVPTVRYVIFEMEERASMSLYGDHPNLDLIDIHMIEFSAYDGIYDELMRLITDFLIWLRSRGLEHELEVPADYQLTSF